MKAHNSLRGRSAIVATLIVTMHVACREEGPLPPNPSAGRIDSTTMESSVVDPAPHGASDVEVRAVVAQEIAFDDALDLDRIRVDVHEGIVELGGVVESAIARERAERIAEHVRGVRAVSNRIEVAAPSRPDAELERVIEGALARDPATAEEDLSIAADDGKTILYGTVSSWQEKGLAETVALSVRGVTSVDSQIEVAWPKSRSEAEIDNDVESRLHWDALVDDALVEVEVEGDLVRLLGTVGSAAEKRRAIFDAWVAGATGVDASELEVDPFIERGKLRSDKHAPPSDEAVREAIVDASRYDPRVAASDIRVEVRAGVVTLEGTVRSERAKAAAASLARNTVGVARVENELVVSSGEGPEISAEALVARARRALLDHAAIDASDLELRVEDDKLVIEGQAETHFEKSEILYALSAIEGLTGLDDRVTVKGPIHAFTSSPYLTFERPLLARWLEPVAAVASPSSDAALERAILHELRWDPLTAPWAIEVTVEDGEVTLDGSVDHYWEANRAVSNAYQAGAKSVKNQIAIEPG